MNTIKNTIKQQWAKFKLWIIPILIKLLGQGYKSKLMSLLVSLAVSGYEAWQGPTKATVGLLIIAWGKTIRDFLHTNEVTKQIAVAAGFDPAVLDNQAVQNVQDVTPKP